MGERARDRLEDLGWGGWDADVGVVWCGRQ